MLQKVLVGHKNLSQRVKGVEELLASIEERRFPGKEQSLPTLKVIHYPCIWKHKCSLKQNHNSSFDPFCTLFSETLMSSKTSVQMFGL